MISTEDENSTFRIKDSFLAPWGLATEELPMHLLWEGEIDMIDIRFPQELEIIEAYNFDVESLESVKTDQGLQITPSDLITPGYLNIVFSDNNTYDDGVVPHAIEALFKIGSHTVESFTGETHIIRPQIQVQEAPEEITLEDSGQTEPIQIDMEYVGFGMAQVAIEAEAAGEFVSEGESFLHDLLDSILETGIHKEDLDVFDEPPEDWKDESDIEVPQEEIEDIVGDMLSGIQEGDLGEKHDKKELLELAKILEEAEAASSSDSDVAAVIYRFIETALLSSILNVVDRHPAEGVSLSKPQTKVKTEAKAREINIEIKLKDNLDNEYESEHIIVEINDERESGGVFETEIETNWENYQVDPDEVFSND